jgi:hypothetical protein
VGGLIHQSVVSFPFGGMRATFDKTDSTLAADASHEHKRNLSRRANTAIESRGERWLNRRAQRMPCRPWYLPVTKRATSIPIDC